ncbi:MAG: hypothetical protein WCL60_00555 [Methylococcales bacterium]|jgi:hypothetical protein
MAKVTPLTGDIMNVEKAQATELSPRTVIKESPKKVVKEAEKQVPLQIRIPASKAKAIKREALEADLTISDYMLACFNAYIKK